MATFVKHEGCPRCGSRNNLGRYNDGSAYCFGCHYTERGTTNPWIGERNGKSEREDDERPVVRGVRHLDEAAFEWLAKYQISIPDALSAGFKWYEPMHQLALPLYDNEGKVCCVQYKNFDNKRKEKAKYYNVGDKSKHFTIYGGRHTGTIVLTEDVVSSLKVGSVSDAFPLLGTSIAKESLIALARLYTRMVVWLDDDKWREGRAIADAAKLLGLSATALLTPLDPKEYILQEIEQWLR